MARRCDITNKGTLVGGKYSNRVRATQFNPTGTVYRKPNLTSRRIFVPELGKTITLTVSSKGLRTIAKMGAYRAMKKAGLI